jgi:hypothetical protein
MGIALFLDDRRSPPADGDWIIARSSAEAIRLLATGEVTYISFDHDLGGEDHGMLVVDWLEARANADPSFPLPAWRVHSANPVGAARIRAAMAAIERRRG